LRYVMMYSVSDEELANAILNKGQAHPRITYREAIKILRDKGSKIKFGDDLGNDEETALVLHCGNIPIHITHFPESLKFFNMKIDRHDPEVVVCSDYIMPNSGETFGSSLREPDVDILGKRLYEGTMYEHLMSRVDAFADLHNIKQEECASSINRAFERYLDLFRNKNIERAGFGLGVARLLQYLAKAKSVKDVVLFPMDRTRYGHIAVQ